MASAADLANEERSTASTRAMARTECRPPPASSRSTRMTIETGAPHQQVARLPSSGSSSFALSLQTLAQHNTARYCIDMTVHVTVLYPRIENYRFDEKYYKDVHMPLVEKKFTPHGLQNWRISRLANPDPSKEAEFGIQAELTFTSADDVRKAFSEAGEEVVSRSSGLLVAGPY